MSAQERRVLARGWAIDWNGRLASRAWGTMTMAWAEAIADSGLNGFAKEYGPAKAREQAEQAGARAVYVEIREADPPAEGSEP